MGLPRGRRSASTGAAGLALVKAAPTTWNLQLDGLVITQVAAWGWTFTVLLFLAGAMDAVGGAAYNHKTKQMPLTLAAIPHLERWRELRGLVTDGARFSWAQGRASRHCKLRPGTRARGVRGHP